MTNAYYLLAMQDTHNLIDLLAIQTGIFRQRFDTRPELHDLRPRFFDRAIHTNVEFHLKFVCADDGESLACDVFFDGAAGEPGYAMALEDHGL